MAFKLSAMQFFYILNTNHARIQGQTLFVFAVMNQTCQEARKDPKVRLGDELSSAAHANNVELVKSLLDKGAGRNQRKAMHKFAGMFGECKISTEFKVFSIYDNNMYIYRGLKADKVSGLMLTWYNEMWSTCP